MHVTVRPWVTASAALVVAGTVAAGPVPGTGRPPATVAVPAVELVALPSWLQWVNNGTAALTAQIAAIANGLQNELDNPLPIAGAILRNQLINVSDVGGALITSAQVLTTALVGVPQLLLNAVFDAIANPLSIPAILTGLVGTVVSTATAAVTPVTAALTGLAATTLTRAVGVFNAAVAAIGPISAALVNVPFAVGGAAVAAASGVVGSLLTLNPFTVIGAVGDGLVTLETASFSAAAGVVAAVGNLRQAVRAAVSYPLPAASVTAAHGAPQRRASRVTPGRSPVGSGHPARTAVAESASKAAAVARR